MEDATSLFIFLEYLIQIRIGTGPMSRFSTS